MGSPGHVTKGHIQSNKQFKITRKLTGKSVTSIIDLSLRNHLKVNLIFLYGGTTGFVDKERTADAAYPDVSKVFDNFFFHLIFSEAS